MLDQESVGVGASMLQACSIRLHSRRNSIFNAILGLSLAVLLFLGGLPLFAMTQEAHASSDQTMILSVDKDSFLRKNAQNANEGASDVLRVQRTGSNHIVVSFDQDVIINAVGDRTLESARLRLHIVDTGNNWGLGGTIEAHRMLVDWAEGNGWNVGNVDPFRGTVPGSTWNCAIDTAIWNYDADCSSPWAGGVYGEPLDFVIVTNNLPGFIEFDVTGDVKDFLSNGSNFGWLIKKTDEYQSGTVIFASRENGAVNGPELVLETTTVETEEVGVISDAAVDPGTNDASVVNDIESNVNNDQVTEPMATSPSIVSDTLTSMPESETGTMPQQMSNSTILGSTPLEQVNSTIAMPDPDITQSNSTAAIEVMSNSTATTELIVPPAQTSNPKAILPEHSVSESNSTLTDAETLAELFSNSTIIIEPIALSEPTNSAIEVGSNSSLSSDPSEVNEVKSLLEPVADLAITEDNDFDWVIAGEMYVYTIIINNSGPSEATNIVLTDTLPAYVIFTTFSVSQGICSESDNTVTCSLGTISSGDYATIAIVVTVNSDVQASLLTHSASVTSDTADLYADNNSITGTINVTTQSDLSVMIEGPSEPVAAGQELTYNITVTNDGPSEATNVVATDDLPEGATFSAATSSQGICSLTDNVVTCNLGTIPDNGSATITIVATINPDVLTDSITNSASVTSDTDRYAGSDTDSDTARYKGPDADNNFTKIVPVEMTKTENGLSASVDIGDIAADQRTELLLLNNTLPDAQLSTIEITPASNVTDVNVNITVSKDAPENIPTPEAFDTLLFVQVSLNASG
ncbi:MAG: DNRLRE domain-containing protein, partial [Nitrososphaerales archaeon]